MSTILSSHDVKIRKPHRCFGCGKVHRTGTKMKCIACADGRTIHSAYWCEVCEAYCNRYFKHDDEIGEGDIYANDPKGWKEKRDEIRKETDK